jgi:thiol-disulfide isomerase/thioredoxin
MSPREIRPFGPALRLAAGLTWAASGVFAADSPVDPAGRPPPPLVVAKWVKGEPLESFAKGKVYVVDFWATWCGPCRAAIPRLTKLAHEMQGRVEVVGISISEHQDGPADTAYIRTVERFVAGMGDKMDYRVAVDTPDRRMHDTWFKAAGTAGIPTAYIIDSNGIVAWTGIGSPDDVERIATAVVNGRFDPREEEALKRRSEAEAAARSQADIAAAKKSGDAMDLKYPGYRAAMERGDAAAALASLETAFKADPESEKTGAYQWKLMLLLQRNNTNEVNGYVRSLLDRYGADDDIMSFASACIVATGPEARFDVRLAHETALRAAKTARPDSRWAQFTQWRLAWACRHMGDNAGALAHIRTALAGVRRLKGKVDFGDLESECEEALRAFEAPPK